MDDAAAAARRIGFEMRDSHIPYPKRGEPEGLEDPALAELEEGLAC